MATIDKKQANYSGLWMAVSFGLAIWFYIYAENEPKRFVSAIRKGGSVWYNDTVYVYKPAIEKTYYLQHEIEPKERP
jgi:hypothetical protein